MAPVRNNRKATTQKTGRSVRKSKKAKAAVVLNEKCLHLTLWTRTVKQLTKLLATSLGVLSMYGKFHFQETPINGKKRLVAVQLSTLSSYVSTLYQ